MPWAVVLLVVAVLALAGEAAVSSTEPTGAPVLGDPGGDAGDTGYLDAAPTDLAAAAGVPLDTYTLARIIASEGDAHSSDAERAAIAWVAVNYCRQVSGQVDVTDGTLTEIATRGTHGAGYYATQSAGGRWISTRFHPRQADVDLAASVLGGATPDPTGGATKFFHVATQDALNQRDPSKWKPSADVTAQWEADGYAARTVEGVSASRFLVFVPGGAA